MHNDCGVAAIIDSMPSSLKQMFQCKQFAAELMERMTAQGMKGELISIKAPRGIWSETFNMNISTNGDHAAIKVGNMVYDNLFPKGIEYSKWYMDLNLYAPTVPEPVFTPF